MKPVYIFIAAIIFFACRKQNEQFANSFSLKTIKEALKDSMRSDDYDKLDFSRAVLNIVDSVDMYFIRVPFKEKNLSAEFVLLKMNREGKLKEGKIIQLDGGVQLNGEGPVKKREWEGAIAISSLRRTGLNLSHIHRGYIENFHSKENNRAAVLGDNVLPEVVVVAYVSTTGGITFSTWLWLNSLLYANNYGKGEGSGGSYYGSLGGNSQAAGGSSVTGSGGESISTDMTMLVDIDTYVNKPAIDIEQYLKCFDSVPDAGAQCEVGIYADIPVDGDPNKIFDFSSGSPGHTFIQIKKTNGSKSIVQNIGFYPKTGWKSGLTNAPIDAKFVDDGMHEFNAGYTKTLTPEEFRSVLTEFRYLKNMRYDIDNYNCTDWALAIFNKQGYGLDIPLYDIPGNYPSAGTSMPQGVYNKLLQMKRGNDVHADKIQIGFSKAWVTNSSGPCVE